MYKKAHNTATLVRLTVWLLVVWVANVKSRALSKQEKCQSWLTSGEDTSDDTSASVWNASMIQSRPNVKSRSSLSIIVASRNDEYAGSSLSRARKMLSQIINNRWWHPRVKVEVLIVEWNSQKDTPHLYEIMHDLKNGQSRSVRVRWLLVSHEMHTAVNQVLFGGQSNDGCSFLEFVAKNAAAQRSCGNWLLFGTTDGFLTDSLLRRVQSGMLGWDIVSDLKREWKQQKWSEMDIELLNERVLYVSKGRIESDTIEGDWNEQSIQHDCKWHESSTSEWTEWFSAGEMQLVSAFSFDALLGFAQTPQITDIDSELRFRFEMFGKMIGVRTMELRDHCRVIHLSHARSQYDEGSLSQRSSKIDRCNQLWMARVHGWTNWVRSKEYLSQVICSLISIHPNLTHSFDYIHCDHLDSSHSSHWFTSDYGLPSLIIPEVVWE